MQHKTSQWPDQYDIQAGDKTNQRLRDFITEQMAALKHYDAQRKNKTDSDITYIFHEHAERVAQDVKQTCLHLGLGERVAENMYWAVLPHDIGKCKLPLDVWDSEEKPTDHVKAFRRTHTLLGAQMVGEILHDIDHPFKDLMIEIMAYHHEQMDGNGTHGVPGDKLSLPVRLAAIVEAYDGYTIWRPHFGDRDISPAGVIAKMRDEKGAAFYDMGLLNAFAEMKLQS